MNYKYALDKSSKKFNCPLCDKKTLVKFIDNETNFYLHHTIGRCDRESSCGYFLSPSSNKPIATYNRNTKPILPTYLDLELIDTYCNNYQNNKFILYLLTHFREDDVICAIEKYLIGTSNHWNGATIFYQIDKKFNICAGKVMLYDCNTGKRVKKPYPHINWLHSVLQLNDFVLQQCLFGLHITNKMGLEHTICLVESEKTAIIMSILFPTNIWLATGSKANFKLNLLQPIKDYTIIAFPDKIEFNDWNNKAELLNSKGFHISCSRWLENKDVCKGTDMADIVI